MSFLWGTIGAHSPPSRFFGFSLPLRSLDITRILRLLRLSGSREISRRRTRNAQVSGVNLFAASIADLSKSRIYVQGTVLIPRENTVHADLVPIRALSHHGRKVSERSRFPWLGSRQQLIGAPACRRATGRRLPVSCTRRAIMGELCPTRCCVIAPRSFRLRWRVREALITSLRGDSRYVSVLVAGLLGTPARAGSPGRMRVALDRDATDRAIAFARVWGRGGVLIPPEWPERPFEFGPGPLYERRMRYTAFASPLVPHVVVGTA